MAPLPPLPPESTRRIYIVYTSGLVEHTQVLRIPPGVSAGTLDDYINEINAAQVPLMDPIDSIIRVDESAAGSNIRFPLFPVGLVGTALSALNNDKTRSAFVSMTGKGTDGRLVKTSFYCLQAEGFVDTRQPLGVVAAVWADWYNAVAFSTTGLAPRTIGGAVATWNAYINTALSAYWQRENR